MKVQKLVESEVIDMEQCKSCLEWHVAGFKCKCGDKKEVVKQ